MYLIFNSFAPVLTTGTEKNSFKLKNISDAPSSPTVHPSPGSEKPINTEADIGCFAGKPRLD